MIGLGELLILAFVGGGVAAGVGFAVYLVVKANKKDR